MFRRSNCCMRRSWAVWLLKTPINSAPELFTPSNSPATDHRPPTFDAMAAIIAMLEEDSVSGGMSCAGDVKDLGIKNATSVEATRPSTTARRNKRRCSHSKRSRSACHSRESWLGISASKTSPTTGSGAVSGCCLVAVCVTSSLLRTFLNLLFPRLRPENQLQGGRYVGLGSRSDDRVQPTFVLECAGHT